MLAQVWQSSIVVMDSVAQMPIPEDWGRPYASLTERNAGTGYPLRNVLATNGSRRGSLIYGAPHRRIREAYLGATHAA